MMTDTDTVVHGTKTDVCPYCADTGIYYGNLEIPCVCIHEVKIVKYCRYEGGTWINVYPGFTVADCCSTYQKVHAFITEGDIRWDCKSGWPPEYSASPKTIKREWALWDYDGSGVHATQIIEYVKGKPPKSIHCDFDGHDYEFIDGRYLRVRKA